MWEPGLPAMQAPWCISHTEVMRSQASQLLQLIAVCSLPSSIQQIDHQPVNPPPHPLLHPPP